MVTIGDINNIVKQQTDPLQYIYTPLILMMIVDVITKLKR